MDGMTINHIVSIDHGSFGSVIGRHVVPQVVADAGNLTAGGKVRTRVVYPRVNR